MSVRVLPRVVIRPALTRPVMLCLAGAACCIGVTGCAQFNKALGQQQASIYFQSSTPVAFKLKVRAACDHLPHVKATPIATSVPLSSAVDVVTYNTTGAGGRPRPPPGGVRKKGRAAGQGRRPPRPPGR